MRNSSKEINIMVDISEINGQVSEFSSKNHGSSELYKEKVFVKGEHGYIPLKILLKKLEKLDGVRELQRLVLSSKVMNFIHRNIFLNGFKKSFLEN